MEVVAAEALLSTFLKTVFKKLLSPEFRNFLRGGKLHEAVEKLKSKLLFVAKVVNDAEAKQFGRPEVEAWLNLFRHAVYDAEDILDEVATEALKEQLNREGKVSYISKYCEKFSTTLKQFVASTETKIMAVIETLEYLEKQKDALGLKETLSLVEQRLESTSLLDHKHRVYGRDDDKGKIIDLLLSGETTSVDEVGVIAIVGMGGVGKTTLAQVLYNDAEVKNHFQLKQWVCVSDPFDVKKLTKTILQKIKSDCKEDTLNDLQESLQKELTGKKFFLVLDDVWSKERGLWDAFRKPFAVGAKGSKILITTRDEDVSQVMGTIPSHKIKLGLLSYDDCWSLFRQCAFTNPSNIDPHKEAIGKEIVKNCKGLPLAISAVGGLLCSKPDVREWNEILKSKIWDEQDNSGTLPALRLSYNHLPAPLKRCFAYCSIFPMDYTFNEEELVLLWVAERLVPEKEGVTMEDTGRKYFRDLLSRSFFQTYDGSTFVMHDLINNLAAWIFKELCFRLEDKMNDEKQYKISTNARHCSYISTAFVKFEPFDECRTLRTFIPLSSQDKLLLPSKVLLELLPKLQYLRVLSLKGYDIIDLPESIKNLKHLRYLDLSYTEIERLPESICTLRNLETLLLVGCPLTGLPVGIGSLISLRHLDTSYTVLEMPPGIGKLKSLQTLPSFVVGKDRGSMVGELRYLSHLRGTLCIRQLQNVVNERDIIEADFESKQHLDALELSWGPGESRDERVEMKVLEMIQPLENLEELVIVCYGGRKIPARPCQSLKTLGLYELRNWEEWSCDGIDEGSAAYRSLRSLEIINCPVLRKIPHRFDALEKLKIDSCGELTAFSPLTPLGALRDLCIRYCPKLKKLPDHLPSLVRLEIRECLELAALPRFASIRELELENCNEAVLTNVVGLTTLLSLKIDGFKKLRVLPKGVFDQLTALDNLFVCNCDELECLSTGVELQQLLSLVHLCIDGCQKLMVPLHSLTSLKTLTIQRCSHPLMTAEVLLPSSLNHLSIHQVKDLECLPDGLIRNSCLGKLEISFCYSLKSFPNGELPPTLKLIRINSCKNLGFLPEEMMRNNRSLEILQISHCDSLPSLGLTAFTTADATNLTRLDLGHCKNLESLPDGLCNLTSLRSLSIYFCPLLMSVGNGGFPTANLREIDVSSCQSLKSLPVHNVTFLQDLRICYCHSLLPFPEGELPTNLQRLRIEYCKNLRPLAEWGFHRLTSLRHLSICGGCEDLVSLLEELLPSTLTTLQIADFSNLRSLSKGLQHLTSLQELTIKGCPKLSSIPKMALPVNLSLLKIGNCPQMKKSDSTHRYSHICVDFY